MPIKRVKRLSKKVIGLQKKALPMAVLAVFGGVFAPAAQATCIVSNYQTPTDPNCIVHNSFMPGVYTNEGTSSATLDLGYGPIWMQGSETSLSSVNGQSLMIKKADQNYTEDLYDLISVRGGSLSMVSPNGVPATANMMDIEGDSLGSHYTAEFYDVAISSDAQSNVFRTKNNVGLVVVNSTVDAKSSTFLTDDVSDSTIINNIYMADLTVTAKRFAVLGNTTFRLNTSTVNTLGTDYSVVIRGNADSELYLHDSNFYTAGSVALVDGSTMPSGMQASFYGSNFNVNLADSIDNVMSFTDSYVSLGGGEVNVSGEYHVGSLFSFTSKNRANYAYVDDSVINTSGSLGVAFELTAVGESFSERSGLVLSNISAQIQSSDTTFFRAAGIRDYFGASSISMSDSSITIQGDRATFVDLNEAGFFGSNNHVEIQGDDATAFKLINALNTPAQMIGGSLKISGARASVAVIDNSVLRLSDTEVSLNSTDAVAFTLQNTQAGNSLDYEHSYLNMGGVKLDVAGDLVHVKSGSYNTIEFGNIDLAPSATFGGGKRNLLVVEKEAGETNFRTYNVPNLEGNIVDHSGRANLMLGFGTNWTGHTSPSSKTGTSLNSVSIFEEGVWTMDANSTVNNLSNYYGTIVINQPSAQADGTYRPEDYYTLTVLGNYDAEDALLVINQELGNSASLGDYFFVKGNVTGTTRLRINKTAGLGARTSGDGILLVRVWGQDNANTAQFSALGVDMMASAAGFSPESFILDPASNVEAGAYRYSLVSKAVAGVSSWYLVTDYQGDAPGAGGTPDLLPDDNDPTLNDVNRAPPKVVSPVVESPDLPTESGTAPTPPESISPVAPRVPYYRSLVVASSVAPAVAQQMAVESLGSFHQRYGDYTNSSDRSWGRAFYGSREVGHSAATVNQRVLDFEQSGASYDLSLSGVQVGHDLWSEDAWGGRIRAGGMISLMDAQANIGNLYPQSAAGDISAQSYGLGAYWNWQHANGSYVDAVAQYTHTPRMTMGAGEDGSVRTKGASLSASLEAGVSIDLSSGWSLQPQAQVLWVQSSLDNVDNEHNLSLQFDDHQSIYTRVGARLAKTMESSSGHPVMMSLHADVWNNSNARTLTQVTNGRGDADSAVQLPGMLSKRWLDVGGSINGALTKSDHVSARVAYQQDLSGTQMKGWSLQLNYVKRW